MPIITISVIITNFTNKIIIDKTTTTADTTTDIISFALKIMVTTIGIVLAITVIGTTIVTVIIEIDTCHFLTTPLSSCYYCLLIQNSCRLYPSSPLRLKCGIS